LIGAQDEAHGPVVELDLGDIVTELNGFREPVHRFEAAVHIRRYQQAQLVGAHDPVDASLHALQAPAPGVLDMIGDVSKPLIDLSRRAGHHRAVAVVGVNPVGQIRIDFGIVEIQQFRRIGPDVRPEAAG
jgi:hypothetical protein